MLYDDDVSAHLLVSSFTFFVSNTAVHVRGNEFFQVLQSI